MKKLKISNWQSFVSADYKQMSESLKKQMKKENKDKNKNKRKRKLSGHIWETNIPLYTKH